MLRFGFIHEHSNTSAEVGAHEYVTLCSLCMLRQQRIVGLSFCFFLLLFQLLYDSTRIGGKNSAGYDSIMGFDAFPEIVAISPNGWEFGIIVMGFPNINTLVLGTAYYEFSIVAETSFNLTAYVYISCEKSHKTQYSITTTTSRTASSHLPLYLHDRFKSIKSYNLILLSFEVTRILSSPGIGSIPLILRPLEFLPRVDRT